MTETNMATLQTLEKKIDLLSTQMSNVLENMATKSDLDDLAIMVKNNFDRVEEWFEKIDEGFEQVDAQFDAMDKRFDRIENVSVGNHERRIENLEDDIRIIKTKVGLKKK
jgi:DNA anti-recombination protein RmuC